MLMLNIFPVLSLLVSQYFAPSYPEHNYSNASGGSQGGQYGLFPLLNAARSFRPSNLLDPNYRRQIFDQMRGYPSSVLPSSSSHSQPGGMGPIPSNFPVQPSHQAWRAHAFEDENHTSPSSNHRTESDTEDEMLKAAIEASKQVEGFDQ